MQDTIVSWGSYVYRDPSKYQYVFFPMTGKEGFFSCDFCHFSCYREDFESIPENKIPFIRQQLETISASDEQDKIVTALQNSQKVYLILGKDDSFWCQYYRISGYHLDRLDMKQEALKARRQALYFAYRMLQKNNTPGKRKETLLICGAMEYLLGNSSHALNHFTIAAKLIYKDPNLYEHEQKDKDEFLTKLLKDYINKIST